MFNEIKERDIRNPLIVAPDHHWVHRFQTRGLHFIQIDFD